MPLFSVLTEGTVHVAGGEEDNARAVDAAIDEFLARVVEVRTHPRGRAQLAGAELCPRAAVAAAMLPEGGATAQASRKQ